MNRPNVLALAAGTCFALAGASVLAEPVSPSLVSPSLSSPFGAPVLTERLADLRGGASNSNMTDGVVRDNVASQVSTGANSVGGGSFAGASGLPTVIQNSGNNVLIQNSTIVNVQFQP